MATPQRLNFGASPGKKPQKQHTENEMALDPSSSYANSLKATSKLAREKMVLDRNIWKDLPEAMLILVVKRLPPAAYCRCRCVCRDWKHLLSSSPWARARTPLTIATNLESPFDTKFFCHSEEKWFSFPKSASVFEEINLALHRRITEWDLPEWILPSPTDWELVDVDAGLCCYQVDVYGDLYICVYNLSLNAFRLISMKSAFKLKASEVMLKLVVDMESKSFTVILVDEKNDRTAFFRSAKRCWCIFEESYPRSYPFGAEELFVWKDNLYAFSPDALNEEHNLLGFDSETGEWGKIHVELPHEKGVENLTTNFIRSDGQKITLIQSYLNTFSVWKLRDNGQSLEPDFSLSMWENLLFGDTTTIIPQKVGTHALVQVCCRTDYIFFVFGSDEVGSSPHICVRYSFATKDYCLTSLLRDGGKDLRLYITGSQVSP